MNRPKPVELGARKQSPPPPRLSVLAQAAGLNDVAGVRGTRRRRGVPARYRRADRNLRRYPDYYHPPHRKISRA